MGNDENTEVGRLSEPVLSPEDERLKFAVEEAESDDIRSFQPLKEFPTIFNFYLYFEAARNPPLTSKFYTAFAMAMKERVNANPIRVLKELRQYFIQPQAHPKISEYIPNLDPSEFLHYFHITKTPEPKHDLYLKNNKIPPKNSMQSSWVNQQIDNIDDAIYRPLLSSSVRV